MSHLSDRAYIIRNTKQNTPTIYSSTNNDDHYKDKFEIKYMYRETQVLQPFLYSS